jgi:hypothetical protein
VKENKRNPRLRGIKGKVRKKAKKYKEDKTSD